MKIDIKTPYGPSFIELDSKQIQSAALEALTNVITRMRVRVARDPWSVPFMRHPGVAGVFQDVLTFVDRKIEEEHAHLQREMLALPGYGQEVARQPPHDFCDRVSADGTGRDSMLGETNT